MLDSVALEHVDIKEVDVELVEAIAFEAAFDRLGGGLPVLGVVEVEEDVGDTPEQVELLVGVVVGNDGVVLLVGDDADQAEPVHRPLPEHLQPLLPQLHHFHQLGSLGHPEHLLAAELDDRDVVYLPQLLPEPCDDLLVDLDRVLGAPEVLFSGEQAVGGVLLLLERLPALGAVELEDGMGDEEELEDG